VLGGALKRLVLGKLAKSRNPQPTEIVMIAGHEVTIRSGSYPAKPDYDYAWQAALARDARVVFDIGANKGQTAFNVLLGGGVEHLVLVEANPEAMVIAAENLIRNGLSSEVRFVTAFLNDESGGEVEMFVVGAGSAGSIFSSHSTTAARFDRRIPVRTMTMDEVVERMGILPDLVILDVEGAEHAVLLGATSTVTASRPQILVEMHSPEEIGGMVGNARRILTWCLESGYRAWYLAEHRELRDAGQISHRGRCHLLLQSAELEFPKVLREIPQGAPLSG